MAAWGDRTMSNPMAVVITTSAVTFVSGLLLGFYATRGYLISPALSEERRRNLNDPLESDASDVDDDVVLDHAPNWANGDEADVRDGLRAPDAIKSKKSGGNCKTKGKEVHQSSSPSLAGATSNEECKLVLVVRTDLGMTKGRRGLFCTTQALDTC